MLKAIPLRTKKNVSESPLCQCPAVNPPLLPTEEKQDGVPWLYCKTPSPVQTGVS